MGIQDIILITGINKIKNELRLCEKIKNKDLIKNYNVKFDENKMLLKLNVLFINNTYCKKEYHIFEDLNMKTDTYKKIIQKIQEDPKECSRFFKRYYLKSLNDFYKN